MINKKRWINTAFIKLGETTRIVNESGPIGQENQKKLFTTDNIGLISNTGMYANSA